MKNHLSDITRLSQTRDSVLRALEHVSDGYACLTVHHESFRLETPEARAFAERFLRIRLSAIEDTLRALGVDVEERKAA